MTVTLLPGDCLALLPTLPSQSVDLILADLPYGTTQAAWDSVIPLDKLWTEYRRVLKPKGAVVLTASQPFTSALVMSNPAWFRYELIWHKSRVTGHLDAKRKPLKEHESVCVFYQKRSTYNPQMVKGAAHVRGPRALPQRPNETYNAFADGPQRAYSSEEYYPRSVLRFPSVLVPVHPNEKPVALFSYLIKTYSNPGDVVLDNTAGSGTTGVAAIETGRRAILMERDPAYCAIIERRLAAAQPALLQEIA